ncbi:MAG: tetratricopeptide repeat protein [Myxococcales bacterium]|nr:tetratricopeptide repeat protein [Myxococcales bacterium]
MPRRAPLLIIAAVVVVWANSISSPLVYDDKVEVVHRAIRDITTPMAWVLYNPGRAVLLSTYAVNWALGGLDPRGYHLVSIGIHAINGVLAWRLASRILTPGRALFATLAWALHPMATEGVTYLSGRSDALVATWILLALGWWIDDSRTPDLRARLGALVATVLAAFTKETAAILPFLLFSADLTLVAGGRLALVDRRRYRLLSLLLAMMIGAQLLRGGWPAPEVPRSALDHFVSQAAAWALYLQLWLVPWGQSILHGLPAVATGWGLAAAFGLGIAAAFAVRERGSTAFAAAMWAFPLAMASAVVLRETVPEHRAYLPGFGLWLFIASRLPERRAIFVVPLLLAGLTVRRNQDWRDEATLWASATKRWPESASAWYGYGQALKFASRWSEAEDALQTSYTLDGRVEALDELGICRVQQGDAPGARSAWERALRDAPGHCAALNNLAGLARSEGDLGAATSGFLSTLRYCPDDPIAHYSLGTLHLAAHESDRAGFHLRAYLAADPSGAHVGSALRALKELGLRP